MRHFLQDGPGHLQILSRNRVLELPEGSSLSGRTPDLDKSMYEPGGAG